jgi:hypothetical protein
MNLPRNPPGRSRDALGTRPGGRADRGPPPEQMLALVPQAPAWSDLWPAPGGFARVIGWSIGFERGHERDE